MNRRNFLKLAAMAGVATQIPVCQKQPAKKPNIVLIYADDLGYGDLGCFGNKRIRTPNLDKVASQGMRLTNFYVTCSVCTPSRSGLLTGRYPQRNGLFENIRNNIVNYKHTYKKLEYALSPEMSEGLDLREITIAQLLKEAGYRTGIFGKWDSGRARRFLPLQRGFDTFYGFANTGIDYWTHERYGVPSLFRGNQRIKEEGYATDLFKREALKFIDENKDRPFFLYLPFNAPHIASNFTDKVAQAPDEYIKMYGDLPGTKQQKYYANVTCLDAAIGEILQKLEKLALEENTLVIFTSDNGPSGPGSAGPLRGRKAQLWEGGIREPFIAKWPGHIPAGVTRDDFSSTLDLFPTFISLAGASLSKNVKLDGFNMLPVLFNQGRSKRKEHYWEFRGQRAVRSGKWKWVLPTNGKYNIPEDTTGELYDLSVDIGEKHNLASERPDVLKEMQNKWDKWMWEMVKSEPRGPFSKAYFDLLGYGDGTARIK